MDDSKVSIRIEDEGDVLILEGDLRTFSRNDDGAGTIIMVRVENCVETVNP